MTAQPRRLRVRRYSDGNDLQRGYFGAGRMVGRVEGEQWGLNQASEAMRALYADARNAPAGAFGDGVLNGLDRASRAILRKQLSLGDAK